MTLTAVIRREGEWFTALCPELDVASQGQSVEEARANLSEALTLFLEEADGPEVQRRLLGEPMIFPVEVAVG